MTLRIFTFLAIFACVCCKKQDIKPVEPVPVDPCLNKNCGFGKCQPTGDCLCDPGYELDAQKTCTILSEQKYAGNFKVSENCVMSSGGMVVNNYNSVIKVGVAADMKVEVHGLCGPTSNGGFANPAFATIAKDSVFFYRQDVDSDGFFLEGKGKINTTRDRIEMTYQITSPSTTATFTCTDVVFQRQ